MSTLSAHLLLLLFVVIALGPLVAIWSSAFKPNSEIALSPLALPREPHLENFPAAWNTGRFGTYAINSAIISVATTTIVVVASAMAGYALSVGRARGARLIMLFFLIGITVPIHGIIVSEYLLVLQLGLLNSLLGVSLVLAALVMPLGVYLMWTFFQGFPSEVSDAARVDGCNEWGVLRHVALPLAVPAALTVALLTFLIAWNDLLVPLILLVEENNRTVSVGLTFFQERYSTDYGTTAAGTTIATIPIVILAILFQRHFVRGLTAGSTTG